MQGHERAILLDALRQNRVRAARSVLQNCWAVGDNPFRHATPDEILQLREALSSVRPVEFVFELLSYNASENSQREGEVDFETDVLELARGKSPEGKLPPITDAQFVATKNWIHQFTKSILLKNYPRLLEWAMNNQIITTITRYDLSCCAAAGNNSCIEILHQHPHLLADLVTAKEQHPIHIAIAYGHPRTAEILAERFYRELGYPELLNTRKDFHPINPFSTKNPPLSIKDSQQLNVQTQEVLINAARKRIHAGVSNLIINAYA